MSFVFMKGTQKFPQCGFSAQVAQILGHLGVAYKDVNVLDDMGIRDGIKAFSNWPTIPQLYVKGEFVGGCDIIREMFQEGELQQLSGREGRVLRQGNDDGLRLSCRPEAGLGRVPAQPADLRHNPAACPPRMAALPFRERLV